MELANLIHQYRPAFEEQYGNRLLPSHHNAINAMLRCRTPQAGEIQLQCSDCTVQINLSERRGGQGKRLRSNTTSIHSTREELNLS